MCSVPLAALAAVIPLVSPQTPGEAPAPVTASPEEAPADAAKDEISYGLSGDWGGLRAELEEQGYTFEFGATLELNRVLAGGIHRHTTGHALYDLSASFDLQRILGWKDALVGLEAYAMRGHNPSDDVGDYQSFSDISCDELAQIGQLFYEQWFANHTCRIKLGKLDANGDFGAPYGGVESMHSGAAYSPTNFAIVTYPDPAAGVLAGWVPDENWSFHAGVYDGASWAGVNTGGTGPQSFFGAPSDLYLVAELGHRWALGERELAGGCTLGAWHHTGDFPDTAGGTDAGTTGFHATVDQELSRAGENEDGGTKTGFLQFGKADEDVSPVDLHLGAGFQWAGCCSASPDDALGCYVSWVRFSDGAGFTASAETVLELDYAWHCCNGVVLRPDLQHISNPGGDASLDDTLVFSLRCELSF